MDGLDKPYLALIQLHHQGCGTHAIAEETHALEQRSVGDSGGREDDVLAWSQVIRRIDTFGIVNAHVLHAFALLSRVPDQTAHHVSIEAADGSRSEHALRSSACTHDGMHARAQHTSGNTGRKIAIADQLD